MLAHQRHGSTTRREGCGQRDVNRIDVGVIEQCFVGGMNRCDTGVPRERSRGRSRLAWLPPRPCASRTSANRRAIFAAPSTPITAAGQKTLRTIPAARFQLSHQSPDTICCDTVLNVRDRHRLGATPIVQGKGQQLAMFFHDRLSAKYCRQHRVAQILFIDARVHLSRGASRGRYERVVDSQSYRRKVSRERSPAAMRRSSDTSL